MFSNAFMFLGKEIELPFTFISKLSFSDEDRLKMPWLGDRFRYYGTENEPLGKGGKATAYRGFISDINGNPRPDSVPIVIKIPNLVETDFTAEQIKEYLSRIKDECGREWQLTRARLRTCRYANPIFDFFCYSIDYMDVVVDLPVTSQLFLDGPLPLENYLVKIGQKPKAHLSDRAVSESNWRGMNSAAEWLKLVRCLATGLADIHQRRVVHGDLWPPNIFIAEEKDQEPHVIYIDFGEAFPLEPRGQVVQMKDQPYRAPERKDAESIVTKSADVYSFGKLILYLAIGEEPIISSELKGYKRREFVKNKFLDRNPGILKENPFILDIICTCVTLDPVDRPGMSDILRALNSYVDFNAYSNTKPAVSHRIGLLKEVWDTVKEKPHHEGTSVGPLLQELIDQRIYEIEEMIKGLSNDVIILNDTREKLLLAMVSLFLRMSKGDRFISITSFAMWQSSALGLDGRYFTASQLAVSRGASVQRTFLFSIQEVGKEWATRLMQALEHLNTHGRYPLASRLAGELSTAIGEFTKSQEKIDITVSTQKKAQNQLMIVIKAYLEASQGFCAGLFDESEAFVSFENCRGFFISIAPVGTNSALSVLKSAHPASVFYFDNASPTDKYLLMMTECHARNPNGNNVHQTSRPELRGLMVFKSVLGVPEDRIKKIQFVFKRSVNLGGWLKNFYEILAGL